MNEVLEITLEQKKMPVADAPQGKLKRVPIIGAGFAGMAAARALKKCEAEIVLIDRRNHHIFQPLLYQVATALALLRSTGMVCL
ncbi:2-polyprenyl-6-methoxyphenol hydroxylase-like FAD-dependent oxidoreductase [Nitrobacteraceae bacterium AZCC 2161]